MDPQKTNDEQKKVNPLLKLALDLGPLVIFFLVTAKFDIFYATASLMITTCLSLLISRLLFKRVSAIALITGVFIMIFGFLTIYLKDETIIKMKPTILYSMFALALAGGLYFRKPVLKLVLGEVMQLQDEGWRILTLRWIGFFVFIAILNEAVWRNFSTPVWSGFKSFAIMPLTFLFMMAQITLIMKHQIPEVPSSGPEAPST